MQVSDMLRDCVQLHVSPTSAQGKEAPAMQKAGRRSTGDVACAIFAPAPIPLIHPPVHPTQQAAAGKPFMITTTGRTAQGSRTSGLRRAASSRGRPRPRRRRRGRVRPGKSMV
jgi:hypothetical protein